MMTQRDQPRADRCALAAGPRSGRRSSRYAGTNPAQRRLPPRWRGRVGRRDPPLLQELFGHRAGRGAWAASTAVHDPRRRADFPFRSAGTPRVGEALRHVPPDPGRSSMPVEPSAAVELRRRAGELRRLAEHARGDAAVGGRPPRRAGHVDQPPRRGAAAAARRRPPAPRRGSRRPAPPRPLPRAPGGGPRGRRRVAGGRLTCPPCSTTPRGWRRCAPRRRPHSSTSSRPVAPTPRRRPRSASRRSPGRTSSTGGSPPSTASSPATPCCRGRARRRLGPRPHRAGAGRGAGG